ncbi:DMT family transporter [Nocardiopsis sp. CNT-189]|uniref:DMT family transporter n=1 Tax=Nocardiopsis oceanisediminis TaxID=2816862 RepID=UPI003B3A755E
MVNWLLLIAAGIVEIAWAQSIKPTDGFTRPLPTLVSLVLMAGAVYLLSLAMRGLPAGTAYVVFTGIGAAGAVLVGILVHGEPAGAGRLAALALIAGGVALAHATAPAA